MGTRVQMIGNNEAWNERVKKTGGDAGLKVYVEWKSLPFLSSASADQC